MKTRKHCKNNCRQYEHCRKVCRPIEKELKRLETGDQRYKKHQHKIDIAYEHQLERTEHAQLNNELYGAIAE